MKKKLFVLIVFVLSINTVFGQKETSHFIYEKQKSGLIIIKAKNENNSILSKGEAVLTHDLAFKIPWHKESRVKPFQELIDDGTFSKERLQKLRKEDNIRIEVYFDETGVVSFVRFIVGANENTLLTDEELYKITQKYIGVKYDMSHARVYKSETGSKTIFYLSDYFYIPYEDLKY